MTRLPCWLLRHGFLLSAMLCKHVLPMYNWVYININLLQVFTFDYKIRNNSHIANLVNLIFQCTKCIN